ncbi:MAG: hypothetical protein ACRDT4_18200 [Micromonosporaceae bacterium]
MTATRRPAGPIDPDVLLVQIDRHLSSLYAARPVFPAPRGQLARRRQATVDLALAERIAQTLRRLVVDTAQASAADRARVRAAVHYFVLHRDGADDRRPRGLVDDVHVVNELLLELGREDLLIPVS